MTRFTSLPLKVSVVSCMFLLQCMQLTGGDGNGSNVGNARVTGVLCNPDGTRARYATVMAVPANFNPLGGLGKTGYVAAIESTFTDDTGGYRFDSLPTATYNILGSNTANRSFIDSIVVRAREPQTVPADTLKPAGALRGVARLQPGDDSRTVLILVMGTPTWAVPGDSTGNFRLFDMAKGRYRVRLVSTRPDYLPLDTHLTIIDGRELALPDTLRLAFTGIATPTGLTLRYDTLMQAVTLHWKSVSADFPVRYNLYRKTIDSNSAPIIVNSSPLTDTVFRDTSAVQDMTYEYSIVAINEQNVEGAKSRPVSITITGLFSKIDSLVFGSGTQAGQFGFIASIAVDSSGNRYVADTKNKRLQKFSPGGAVSTLSNMLSYPYNLYLGSETSLFVSEYDRKQIVIFDTDGNSAAPAIAAKGSPFAFCESGSRRFVVSDSGLEIYGMSNMLQAFFPLDFDPFNYFGSGDVVAHGSGTLFLFFDDDLYAYDTLRRIPTPLFSAMDNRCTQCAKLAIIQSDFILLHTSCLAGPWFSTLRVFTQTGELKARWQMREQITGMCVDKNGKVVVATYDGTLFTLRQNCLLR
jgi:hypothetical protein